MVHDIIATQQALQASVLALERKVGTVEHKRGGNRLGGLSSYSSVTLLKRFKKMKNYFHFEVMRYIVNNF